MNEGIFALNKFMMSTELPGWKVCESLGVFLAQGFGKIFDPVGVSLLRT